MAAIVRSALFLICAAAFAQTPADVVTFLRGTATDLGSDCNPQTGAECQNAGTCVDGYCK